MDVLEWFETTLELKRWRNAPLIFHFDMWTKLSRNIWKVTENSDAAAIVHVIVFPGAVWRWYHHQHSSDRVKGRPSGAYTLVHNMTCMYTFIGTTGRPIAPPELHPYPRLHINNVILQLAFMVACVLSYWVQLLRERQQQRERWQQRGFSRGRRATMVGIQYGLLFSKR